ncbi:MAG TPA: nuclear transport factor 2 family protein [Gemmatimonadaceae bacterium]
MYPFDQKDPGRFIADFFTSFTEDLLRSDEDAAMIVDRYHTPDIVEIADGYRIDREGLIEHAIPIRRNRPTIRVEAHEALADGDRIAALYTMHVRYPKKRLAIEVHFFGEFAPDGRMRRSNMSTRILPADANGGPSERAPATHDPSAHSGEDVAAA